MRKWVLFVAAVWVTGLAWGQNGAPPVPADGPGKTGAVAQTQQAAESLAPGKRRVPPNSEEEERLEQELTMKCRSNSDVDGILKTRAKAPALPAPTGKVVKVATIEEFKQALQTAESGSTILLADGVYPTDSLLLQDRERITIRSASGDREKVILDGEGLAVAGKRHWALALHGTPDFTIADITMRNFDYGVYIFGDGNVQQPLIHNMKFQNIWIRGVKGTHAQRIWDRGNHLLADEQTEEARPHDGRIQYCLFVNDRPKENIHDGFEGDYISGIDMMWLVRWTISDNTFIDIRGHNGGGRGAIFVWVNSREVVAERNVIVNCDRGICFGNPMAAENGMPHMIGGIARNNFIVAGARQAIEFQHTVDCIACNNTIYGRDLTYERTVEFQNGNRKPRFVNNLVHGSMYMQDGVDQQCNIIGDLAGWFVNPALGDLHLNGKAGEAVGKAGVAMAAPAKGPLKVLPSNPRYFTDGTGKAVYLTGSHTWANQNDHGTDNPPAVFDFNAYLDFLEAHHHNFIRLRRKELCRYSFPGFRQEQLIYVAGPQPWPRTGPGLALDGLPRFDLSKFDSAYFDRLRSRVIAARDRGFYVSVMFFDGHGLADGKKPWCWDGHPFHMKNNINGIDGDPNKDGYGTEINTLQIPAVVALQEAYLRKVVDTVNDLDNVLYEVSNESENFPGCLQWQSHVVTYVKKYEATKPKQHPVGITFILNSKNADLFASPADWISPSGADGFQTDPPPGDGRKVILNDTDHSFYYTALKKAGPQGHRAWVWKNFTRGHHTVFMDPYLEYDPDRNRPKDGKLDPYWETIRVNMGYTRLYADRMNLAAMTPQPALASSGYCLASTAGKAAEILVYLPEGPEVTVNLSGISGKLSVEWFNPSTGAAVKAEPVAGGGKAALKAPFGGDAVLYMVHME